MSKLQQEPINIFIAYSRKDRDYLTQLLVYTKPLCRKDPDITIWHDGEIASGSDRDKTIKAHLDQAHIILLLISPDSLASDYFYNEEVKAARKRHYNNTAIVIPVILRSCLWQDDFGDLQALPKDGISITKWNNIDDAFTDIAKGIKRSVQNVRGHRDPVEKERIHREKIKQERIRREKEAEERERQRQVEEKKTKIAALPTSLKNLLRDMVFVKGGTFQMGSDDFKRTQPIHTVILDSFKIGKYPITQVQYEALVNDKKVTKFQREHQYPVENVSWNDAQIFIQKLNEITGENFRLPTESEWEFAARGGIGSNGYLYNDIDNVAWYYENSEWGRISPVGMKAPNELGIYDMSGNVWEWCQDWHEAYNNEVQQNPRGPIMGRSRILRGGSAQCKEVSCRLYRRLARDPYNGHGFRLVLSIH